MGFVFAALLSLSPIMGFVRRINNYKEEKATKIVFGLMSFMSFMDGCKPVHTRTGRVNNLGGKSERERFA